MYFPKQVYELLPVLYLTFGMFSLFAIENTVGKFFGLVLFLISLLIVKMRVDYRLGLKN